MTPSYCFVCIDKSLNEQSPYCFIHIDIFLSGRTGYSIHSTFFPIRLDKTIQVMALWQKCWGCCTDERGRDQSYSFCLRSFASCLIGNENNIEFFSKFCQTCPLLQNGVCVIDWQIILWQILAASSTRSSVAFVARGVMVSNPLQLGVLAAPVIFCFKSSKS